MSRKKVVRQHLMIEGAILSGIATKWVWTHSIYNDLIAVVTAMAFFVIFWMLLYNVLDVVDDRMYRIYRKKNAR